MDKNIHKPLFALLSIIAIEDCGGSDKISKNKPISPFAVMFCIILIFSLMAACSPVPTSTPIPPPTSTDPPQPTETTTPTATPTAIPTPKPTVAKVSARVCAVQPDGKAAGGAYIQVSDANFAQVIPDDGSTGIQSPGSGCISIKLPPGFYHIRSQKVVNAFEGLYIFGGADVDLVLGESLTISVELKE